MKMKYLFNTTLTILLSMFMYGTIAAEVEWRDWDEGFEEAQENGKPILLSVYTDWCGWCDRMDNDTYGDKEVAEKVHDEFIPIKFNPEEDKTYQMGEDELTGPQLLGALTQGEQTGYPTTLFLNVQERRVFMEAGYKPPEAFDKLLDEMAQKVQ